MPHERPGAPTGGASASGSRWVHDPRLVGRDETHCRCSASRCCLRSIRDGWPSDLSRRWCSPRRGWRAIPRGALPSIPRWLWVVIAIGGITAAIGGGPPEVHIGSVGLELGGLFNFLRITVLSIVLLGLGAMVSWTTNVAEVRAGGRDARPTAAATADPDRRVGCGAGFGASCVPDVDRRIPRSVRGSPAAATSGAERPDGHVVDAGQSR